MVFYCPDCWAEVRAESEHCPACGRSLAASDVDFVDKLISALHHPEPTRAALAIQILSDMLAEPRAILPLINLLGTARVIWNPSHLSWKPGDFRRSSGSISLR